MKWILMCSMCFTAVSAWATVPVTAAKDQQKLLKSSDAKLAKNKKLVYDFTRVILEGLHLERVKEFMREDYIQHNPNVATGMKGFVEAFSKAGEPKEIPNEVDGLVSITAEGDLVTMAFVSQRKAGDKTYTTTWFDMFRVQDGKIAEHWDCATIKP